MIMRVFFIVTSMLICSSISNVDAVNCYISSVPIQLNYALTSDNIPLLSNNTVVSTDGHCVLTILWLKDPISSMIILGYDTDSPSVNSLNDTLLVQLRNQLDGEVIEKKTSKEIQYRCRSTDRCNNEQNLRNILSSLDFDEQFSPELDSLIASNPSFDQQSISNCYYNGDGTSTECPSRDPIACPRCQMTLDLIKNKDCGTCPRQTSDANTILWSNRYLFDNQSIIESFIQLSCQSGRLCNGLDNIRRIQQLGSIKFRFNKGNPTLAGFNANVMIFLSVISFVFYFVY